MPLSTRTQSILSSVSGVQVATIGTALTGGVLIWLIATQVFPYHSLNHDEGVYLQQAAMLLDGQLNLYPPVDDSFRPWFFIDAGDRLYPKYAPVPAAMFALGHLLGGYRVALVGIAIGNLLLVMAIVRMVFDDRTSTLAGLFLLASPLFLIESAVFLPYAPTTLLNLLFAYAYLRAESNDSRLWAGVAGAAIGLAFFARPYTAVLFATPFIVHALWSLWRQWPASSRRLATTSMVGLTGVGIALLYNTIMTGSPWVFPYQAFAPRDGLGFGYRQLLGHELLYTPELAIRVNQEIATVLFTEWIAGGVLGTTLVLLGLLVVIRQGISPEQAILGGLFASVIIGNVYFWGNFNILGDLDVAGDGLIGLLGPYYHFDLLLPIGAFAAAGALHLGEWLRHQTKRYLRPRQARIVVIAILLIGASTVGAITIMDMNDHIEANMDATTTYQTAYAPFAGGPPANSLIFLPTPYGDWLNHPFQVLRNDPGFNGQAVYTIDDHPFAVVNAFPDRSLYRYEYRGMWAPFDGSPEAAKLQPVSDISARAIELDTTIGIPEGATSITIRVGTDSGSAYFIGSNWSDRFQFRTVLRDEHVSVHGPVSPLGDNGIGVTGRNTVRVIVFVDYGAGGGFSYRFDIPVHVTTEQIRAISPRIEWCQAAQACGGAAAYIEGEVPSGIFVRSNLTVGERNP